MSFLRRKAAAVGAVLSVVMSAAMLGSSLIYAATGSYKSWKQYKSSWSSMQIGNSGETVAQSGCAVTSAAILMVKSGSVTEDDFNPGVIVDFMNHNGGFEKSGSIRWGVLTGYAPDFTFVQGAELSGTQAQKTAKIKEFLDAGYYAIASVKNSSHFVAIDSVNGDEVIMMDPGSSSTSLFEKYPASGVNSLRLFKGAESVITKTPVKVTEKKTEVFPDVPETVPAFLETAPETAPPETMAPETLPAVIPEPAETTTTTIVTTTTAPVTTTTVMTTTSVPETTTASETTASSETSASATAETTTAMPATAPEIVITTKAATVPEIIITTKAVTSTEAPASALTVNTETTLPDEDNAPEAEIVDPVSDDVPDQVEAVQIVILENAPETAPDEELSGDETPEAKTIYIPKEQAEATLFQIKDQYVFMTIKFQIQGVLSLRAEADKESEILTVIPSNTYLDVVEIDEEFKWGKVAFEGQEGWISLDFTAL